MSLKRVNGSSSMLKLPATTLKMIPDFYDVNDSCLQGKTIRQILHGRFDSKGNDVSGFFVPMDVVNVVLGIKTMKISVDIAPSLRWVDGGNSTPLAVVKAADLSAVVKNQHTNAVVSVASAVQPPMNPVEEQDMLAVQKPPVASTVLPINAFKVDCKNESMYGKKMRDVNIGGFSVLSDDVIRFRTSDHKPFTAYLLVAVGRYLRVADAHDAIKKMVGRKDDKTNDLVSLEFDNKLTEDPVCRIFFIIFVPLRHLRKVIWTALVVLDFIIVQNQI